MEFGVWNLECSVYVRFVSFFLAMSLAPSAVLAQDAGALLVPGTRAGQRCAITVAGVELTFQWCPPGSCVVGSPTTEKGRGDDEIEHKVTLTKGFWIQRTETTQRQYRAVVGVNPSRFRGDDRPVDSVSWLDASAFCRAITAKAKLTTRAFTLPSEAQWEYAARAGAQGSFAGKLTDVAWFDEPTESGSTHAVGTKAPNAWGIHDMLGNLWEWCADAYADRDGTALVDPCTVTGQDESVRIDRGGCWDSKAEYCRYAHRGVYETNRHSRFVGFRIVLVP